MLPNSTPNIASLSAGISPTAGSIVSALKAAASETGADFGYLLRTAMRESSLNPEAKAATSSATGLFQFIEQTWLGTVDRHGAEHGLKAYAEHIQLGKDGRFFVADPKMRQEILALRNDAKVSALMAGEMTIDTRSDMEAALGRGVSAGELYVAHFLGPQAAVKMIKAAGETPSATAANLFPEAASANRTIFYDKMGRARPLSEVLSQLTAKHQEVGADIFQMKAGQPALREDGLRGAFAESSPPVNPPNGFPGMGLGSDMLVLAPLMVQLLASLETPASFLSAFGSKDDDGELRN